jgi:hypothetical protein
VMQIVDSLNEQLGVVDAINRKLLRKFGHERLLNRDGAFVRKNREHPRNSNARRCKGLEKILIVVSTEGVKSTPASSRTLSAVCPYRLPCFSRPETDCTH